MGGAQEINATPCHARKCHTRSLSSLPVGTCFCKGASGRLWALIGESLHLVPALLAAYQQPGLRQLCQGLPTGGQQTIQGGIAAGSGRQRLTAVVELQVVEQGGGIGLLGWKRTAKAEQAALGCG